MFDRPNHSELSRLDFQPGPGDRAHAIMAMPRSPIPNTGPGIEPPTTSGPPPLHAPTPGVTPAVSSPIDTLHDLIDLLQAQPNMSTQMKLHIIREVMQSLAPPVHAMPALTPGVRLLNDPIYATTALASQRQE